MNESVTEFLRIRLPAFLWNIKKILLLCKVGVVVVAVGGCGGTNSGSSASPVSFLSSAFL